FSHILHEDIFFFFFSSRRRHTRFSRDWSSDVCSSDLYKIDITNQRGRQFSVTDFDDFDIIYVMDNSNKENVLALAENESHKEKRSEERRVGKECRSGWWRDHEKKKQEGVGGDRVVENR